MAGARQQSVVPGEHGFQIIGGGDHREHDVAAGEIGRMIHQDNARGLQRFGLGARTVVAADIGARLGQPLGHGAAHASEADPSQAVIANHSGSSCTALSNRPATNRSPENYGGQQAAFA